MLILTNIILNPVNGSILTSFIKYFYKDLETNYYLAKQFTAAVSVENGDPIILINGSPISKRIEDQSLELNGDPTNLINSSPILDRTEN